MRHLALLISFLLCHVFSMADNSIPFIMLNGELTDEYSVGTMKVFDNNEMICDVKVKLKIRGGTSRKYEKKSIAIKLIDDNGESIDMSFFGMRSDNNWILDAMAMDRSRMRNRVAFDLWNDMSTPSFIQKEYEPKALNGIRGRFVELYLNYNYRGIYCLNEKLDRKQLKLKKYKNGVIKGLLYKADTWSGTMYNSVSSSYDNKNNLWMGWDCKYPDLDDGEEIDWKPLIDNIRFVAFTSKTTFLDEVEERFDLPVLMDYIIFYTLINAQDNYGKNLFAYFYDITKDKRQGLAPWDLDATFGRGFEGEKLSYYEIPDENYLFRRLRELYPNFKEKLSDRYHKLRYTYLKEEQLIKRFSDYYDELKESGALLKEYARWNGVDDIKLDFKSELDFISNWIVRRLDYMDYYIGRYTVDNIAPVISDRNSGNGRIYNISGQEINEADGLSKGIYIRNGKKFIVK